jgi:hypothetical protein
LCCCITGNCKLSVNVTQADCKFLIFAHHQTMLDGIEEVLMVSSRFSDLGLSLHFFPLKSAPLNTKTADHSGICPPPLILDHVCECWKLRCSVTFFLQKKKVGHIRIDGGTPQSARQALVTRFQETDSVRAAVVCGCLSLCPIDYNSFICGKWCLIFQH